MATIRIKFRASSVPGQPGTVYYQITHRRSALQVSSGVKVFPEQWNQIEEAVYKDNIRMGGLQSRIESGATLLRQIIKEFEMKGYPYSAADIVKRYRSSEFSIPIQDYMQSLIVQMRDSNRMGTALNYEKALNIFSEFMKGEKICFIALTDRLVEDFNAFLTRRGMVRNSVSFYMRIMRAVYNKAVRQKIAVQTHPFDGVYTGIDRTRKRAVAETVISQMYRLNLDGDRNMEFTRDLFIFSYCTRGMAFIDMAYLKKSDIQGGCICYSRHKTGQKLIIKVEPCIQDIIDRYDRPGSPFVFPILSSTDPNKSYRQYQLAINRYNHLLVKIARHLKLPGRISSYTARHSWATAARDHNIPISVISAGMGHSSEQTTRIYLAALENSVIDDANHGILDSMIR